MTWKKIIKKEPKPDYLDFDKDGDKKEPMTQALKDKKKPRPKPKNPFTRSD